MNNTSRCLSTVYNRHTLHKLMSRVGKSTSIMDRFQGFKKIHNGNGVSSSFACLKSRGLVRLQGNDTGDFLQGLVTNDVDELMRKEYSIQYSFMLNVQGRVLYDLFMYNLTGIDGSTSTVFVEVPLSAIEEFIILLKRYKLRRKVDISNVSDELKVWSQFPLNVTDNNHFSSEISPSDAVVCCSDPRLADFGRRFIRRTFSEENIGAVDESVYTECRYKWGLPEGVDDLPPGSCFPLECNAIFMNGVNFDKGCYIGQELTARTHHTGVTRKRLMPLVFKNTPPDIEKGVTIQNEKGRNAGKFRGSQGSYGLGLLRLARMNENLSLTASDNSQVSLTTHLPHWWPKLDN